MPMAPFFMKFPEITADETRSLFVFGDDDLPDGEYGLLEFYCDEKDCDCCRVIFNVVEAERPDKVLATINYGWESAKFYGKWGKSPGLAKEHKGPFLDPLNRQTQYAPALLRLFEEYILPDSAYIKRLKRHYEMFKQAVAEAATPVRNPNRFDGRRIGRNEPCSCSSGKKIQTLLRAKGKRRSLFLTLPESFFFVFLSFLSLPYPHSIYKNAGTRLVSPIPAFLLVCYK